MSEGTRRAVTDVVILIAESGLLHEGVKAWEVDNLARHIVARLTGRAVTQVAEAITEEIIATPTGGKRAMKHTCPECGQDCDCGEWPHCDHWTECDDWGDDEGEPDWEGGAYCYTCYGDRWIVTCPDDLCRSGNGCMHGDGEKPCPKCNPDGMEPPSW